MSLLGSLVPLARQVRLGELEQDDFYASLGDAIRAARTAKGLSQGEVGIACGYPPSSAPTAIHKIEIAKHHISNDRYVRICEALEIAP